MTNYVIIMLFISNKKKIERAVCNHIRSVLLFTESIGNKNAFKSKRCADSKIFGREDQKLGDKICVEPANQMGYFTDKSEEGAFYVKTKNSSRFACKDVLYKLLFFILCFRSMETYRSRLEVLLNFSEQLFFRNSLALTASLFSQ